MVVPAVRHGAPARVRGDEAHEQRDGALRQREREVDVQRLQLALLAARPAGQPLLRPRGKPQCAAALEQLLYGKSGPKAQLSVRRVKQLAKAFGNYSDFTVDDDRRAPADTEETAVAGGSPEVSMMPLRA